MCRLFGLTSGTARVRATFWLLDAPDSLEVQSHRNVDGSGIGFFDAAGRAGAGQAAGARLQRPRVQPRGAGRPRPRPSSRTCGGRPRAADDAEHAPVHHGAAGSWRTTAGSASCRCSSEQLGDYADLVLGDTDSERYFALITQQIDAHGGDVGAGHRGRGRLDRRQPAGQLAEHGGRRAGRAVGAALPGPARAAHPGAPAGHRDDRPGAGSPACTSAALPRRCTCPRLRMPRPWWSRPSGWTARTAGACSPPASSYTSGPT